MTDLDSSQSNKKERDDTSKCLVCETLAEGSKNLAERNRHERINQLRSVASQITRPRLIPRYNQLSEKDLYDLSVPIKIENDLIMIDRGSKGRKLRTPVQLDLKKVLDAKEKGLIEYIINAFIVERPSLLPFVFDNQSILKLARHFLRHCTGSIHSLYSYTGTVQRYSSWIGYSPDYLIQDTKPKGEIPDPLIVQDHCSYLEEFIANLQDEGLSAGRVNCYAKHIKTFYRVNSVKIELSEPISRRVTFKDRSPTPEELTRMLEIADLRERAILSTLALGAFREETLSKLQYRHVEEDLEKGITPIHVHIEAEITKGKYGDYDTFLGAEGAEYLRLYIEMRKRGSPDGRNPPETLQANSPLIRDKTRHTPRPIGSKQVRKIIHQLYAKAGLLKTPRGRMYDLRVHSLRKYFKTQLLSLGVQPDYVDYMMGHTIDTYHDIQMKGTEFLRNVYSSSGLSIKPKTKVSKIELIKEIIRAQGLNPEQILTKEALTEPATTITNQEDNQLRILSNTLRELIHQETTGQIRSGSGGPGGN